MSIDVTQIIIAVIGLAFTGIIIPLVKAAFDWLKTKTQSEALKSAISEAQTVADTVVSSLQQTVVEGLKEKSADGKLTAEDAKAVAEQAIEMFLSDISHKSLEVIENNADDIIAYIQNLLESRLSLLKK
jgi:type I site-specific restriction-modification system R (restriction) subunit